MNWGPANLSSAFLTPFFLQEDVLGASGTLIFFGCVAVIAGASCACNDDRQLPIVHLAD